MKKAKNAVVKRRAQWLDSEAQKELKALREAARKHDEKLTRDLAALNLEYDLVVEILTAQMSNADLVSCLRVACARLADEPCDRCAP